MATMNTNASINVSVRGVDQLNNLQSKLAQTNNAFAGLKDAVLGFATAGFIAGLYKMANELTDMASATNISTQAILGFASAVSANGGSMDGATKAIGRFATAIDGAAQGSKELQDSFLDLNVSLDDLRNLSEEDLLKKTLEGLSKVEDASKRVAMGVRLFGKEFRSVDVKSVADQYEYFLQKAGLSAAAVQSAGEASQNFSNAFKSFGIQVLSALKPISDLAVAILSMKGVIEPVIIAIVGFGTAWLVFAKAIPAVKLGMEAIALSIASSGGVIAALERQLLGVTAGVLAFGKNIARAFGFLPTAFGGVASLTFAFSGLFRGILRFAGIIGIFYTLFEIIDSITKTITGSGLVEWGEKALKALGIISQTSAEKEKAAAAAKKQESAEREVTSALQKEKLALDNIVESYRRANEEANKKFKLDTEGIRLGEAQKLLNEEQLSAYTRYASQYNKLQDQIDEKKASSSASDRAFIPQLIEAQKALTKEYNVQKDAITGLVAERVANTQAKQLELFQTKSLIDSQNQLQTIQDNIAKSTMSEIEKKYYDIDAAAKASAKSAIEAEEARRGTKMPLEEQEGYYAAARAGSAELKKITEQEYKNSRDFSTGWAQAFVEYRDNATNAAQQARTIFQSVTSSMEDMLFNFFKTGKLGWKNFTQTIIDTLMRSQIQQLVGKIMSPMAMAPGGKGGLLGGALIPGILAEGGPVAMNRPYIVGERGPELFIPASNGSMISNNNLAAQATGNVTYNISAVDALSFKEMIARDPTFLYAVTEQGRRRLPGGR